MQNRAILIIMLFFFGLMPSVYSATIFIEDFDDMDDWEITQPANDDTATSSWTANTPDPFDSYYILGTSYGANDVHNSIIISSTNAYDGSGKAATFWNESGSGTCDSGGGWCSDNQIGVDFGDDYDEVYVKFKLKIDPDWEWNDAETNAIKIFRVGNWQTGSPFSFGTSGNVHPVFFYDIVRYGSSSPRGLFSYRYENSYFPTSATPSHTSADSFTQAIPTDGGWHTWKFHIKINSSAGTADGEVELWVDDVLINSVTNLAWIDTGGTDMGWNYCAFGGNNLNEYAASPSSYSEQYYVIDDIEVTTDDSESTPSTTSSGGAGSTHTGSAGSRVIGS